MPKISFYTTLVQLDSHYICTTWFQGSALAQPDVYYIRSIWFHSSTPAQPGIFVDDIIVHYTRTTWISLHSYNMISGFYTCTTWNLCLFGKMTFSRYTRTLWFSLYTQIFLGLSFWLCVMFSYISIFRTHIHVSTNTLPWFESRLFFPCR